MDTFIWKFCEIFFLAIFPGFVTLKFTLNYLRQFLFNS